MMILIFDTDALIKLNRVGMLELVLRRFECLLPEAVYKEAVLDAKGHAYVDAEEIERLVAVTGVRIMATPAAPQLPRMGIGESAAMALTPEHVGDDVVIVSDDKRFISHLASERRLFFDVPALVAHMARERLITFARAKDVLARLRPYSSKASISVALDALGEEENP
ncbi:MAG: hypothetical protein HY681_14860 [Chloroflexi bacterium]|nr:hypothetical protein [Chloroflexota bacterium]